MTYKLTKTSLNPDPYYGAVSLLLSGDGANNSTDIRDSSRNTKAITVFGDAKISTAQSKFGGASLYFDGTGDYFSCSQPADGTADTTIEFWMYPTSSTVTYRALVDTRSTAPSDTGFGIFQYGLTIEVYGNGLKFLSGANVIAVNQWQHLAVVRSAGVCQIYINGMASGASANYANNLTSTSLTAGSSASLASPYVGYIDELRITKGVARYTSNFTPPTQPFLPTFKVGADPEFYNTSLLLHGDGANGSTSIVDSSYDPKTITVNGNAQISTAQSKFGGSSLAFDGTGDRLVVTNNSQLDLPGDFTIEAWVYQSASPPNFPAIFERGPATTAFLGWQLNNTLNTNSNLTFQYSNPKVYVDAGNLGTNQWAHVATTREGTLLRTFFNGELIATATISNNFTSTNNLIIADSYTAGDLNPFKGFVDEFRITKGVARYTSNFTPPTQPFPNF